MMGGRQRTEMLFFFVLFFVFLTSWCSSSSSNVTSILSSHDSHNAHCFTHEIEEDAFSGFKKGDVWKICLPTEFSDEDNNAKIYPLDSSAISSVASSVISERKLQSSSNVVVHVGDTTDAPSNSTACEQSTSFELSTMCNLRSAWSHCIDNVFSIPGSSCTISLLHNSFMTIDATLGELFWSTTRMGSLTIEGNNCSIHAVAPNSFGTRLLNISKTSVDDPSSAEFYMQNLTLRGFGDESLNGGTLYLQNILSGFIQDIIFVQSTGGHGGAVFIDASLNFQLERSLFIDNLAIGDGGGLYFSRDNLNILVLDCEFSNNAALGTIDENKALGGGVAIWSNNVFLTFQASLFKNNTGVRGGGIGVYDINLNLHIRSCIFEDNHAYVNGGGIYLIFDNTHLIVEGSLFKRNTAEYGGAIRFWTGHYYVQLLHNVFDSNEAIVGGGAIHVYGNNFFMDIHNCSFLSNDSSDYGGAIAANSGNYNMNFTNCRFRDNVALNYGGGIALLSDNRYLNMTECSFESNIAGLAGGGFYTLVLNMFMLLEDCVFDMNEADLYGGGVYFGSDHKKVWLRRNLARNNFAESGAGVFISGFNSDILVDGCVFEKNTAQNFGGGMSCFGQNITIIDSTFRNNTGEVSGGLYLRSGSERQAQTLILSNSSFESNHAFIRSGGLEIELFRHVKLTHCTFRQNAASIAGGGANILRSSVIDITDTTFSRNICPGDGGALRLSDLESVSVANTTFRFSIAVRGGAVWMDNCYTVMFDKCDMFNNSASWIGGGYYVNGTSGLAIRNSNISSNIVFTSSGSSFWGAYSQPVTLTGNYFSDNWAPKGGGTVFFRHSRYMQEPVGLTTGDNVFDDSNRAVYGQYWATQGTHLNSPNITANVTVYGENLPPIIVQLLDYYGQQTLAHPDTAPLLRLAVPPDSNCDGQEGYLTGDISATLVEGQANFDAVQALCAPRHSMDLAVVASAEDVDAIILKLSFRACRVGEYYSDRICSMCRNGTYSFVDPADKPLSEIREVDVCTECPWGVSNCYGNNLVLEEGFWRINADSDDVFSCPMGENSCTGGSTYGEESCSPGYEGPLCAVCSDGYHSTASGDACESCSNSGAWLDSFTVTLIVLFVLFLAAVYFIVHKVLIRKEKLEHIDDFFGLILLRMKVLRYETFQSKKMKLRKKAQAVRRRCTARLKIYIAFFQILSVLSFVLDFEFPAVYSSIVGSFRSFVNLNLSGSTVINCSIGSRFDFIDRLLFDTIYPAVVVSFIIAVGRCHWSRIGPGEKDRRDKIRSNYTFALLLFLYMILPFTSSTIFQTFSCKNVDPDDVESEADDRYMSADYSISCETNRYKFGLAYAICALFVYPIGVPTLYFVLLYRIRQDISSRFLPKETAEEEYARVVRIQPFIFLFDNYKCNFWYWEVIETSYRLALTGLLVLVAQGSPLQIIVGFLVAMFFYLLYEHFKPFHDPILEQLQHVALLQVAAIFFITLIIKAEFVGTDSVAMNILLIFAIFLSFIIDMVSSAWSHAMSVLYPTRFNTRNTSVDNSMYSNSMYDLDSDMRVLFAETSVLHTVAESSEEVNGASQDQEADGERDRCSSVIEMSPRAQLSMIK